MNAAKANLRMERSNFFPSLGINAGWTRQQTSGNTSEIPQTTQHYYDASINMGNNVSNSIPGAIMGMSRDCFEEYLCATTGKPISQCGCHNPDMGQIQEMENRDGRLLQTVCLPKAGEYTCLEK